MMLMRFEHKYLELLSMFGNREGTRRLSLPRRTLKNRKDRDVSETTTNKGRGWTLEAFHLHL
jgi:hypothetical protein